MTTIDKIALSIDVLWGIFFFMSLWVLLAMYNNNYEEWKEETMKDLRGRIFLYTFSFIHYLMLPTIIYWPLMYIWKKL